MSRVRGIGIGRAESFSSFFPSLNSYILFVRVCAFALRETLQDEDEELV